MAKTRSQAGNITVKKEEQDVKPTLVLNGVNNTKSKKITKRTPPVTKNRTLPAQQVKVEEDIDTKSLFKSLSKYSKLPKGQKISQEQINQLIHYIVNDNMSKREASRKVNISHFTALYYYNVYKNDPEKRIPVPRNQRTHRRKYYTQEQVVDLIKYVDDDKMTIKEASAKANVHYDSGKYYYNRYLKDPNHTIPIPQLRQFYTQEQKNKLLGYIVNDKMSIAAASKKAKISLTVAYAYYHKYCKQQNLDIATPRQLAARKRYTQEQIKEVIGYIADDKMSTNAASKKANMGPNAVKRHFRQYLNDNNMEIPVPKMGKRCTQGDINKVIGYIVDDKMSIKAASEKVNMSLSTGYKYYRQYLKEHSVDSSIRKRITQDQINEFIGYIKDNKMNVKAASRKANLAYTTSHRHYHRYLKAQKRDTPAQCPRVVSARKNK
jgi:transposase